LISSGVLMDNLISYWIAGILAQE